MISMRSSGAAVFTRQNPFPPNPPLPKSHYSPSRERKIPKQQKKLALSPVRFAEPPSPLDPPNQTSSLRTEDQVFHERSRSVLLCPPASTEHQLIFSESWPSTDLSSSTLNATSSPHTEAQSQAMRNTVATATTEAKEPSILAKYIERFRFGKPQSREERQHQAIEGEDDQPFWWTSTSPLSSSTPSQTSENLTRGLQKPLDIMNDGSAMTHSPILKPLHAETTQSPARCVLDLSMLTLSELSHCDTEEPEILQLQERASHLLQRSEHSLSSGSVPVSSEGLGCSDFSSPVSTDEPVCRPVIPTLMGSTNFLDPSLCEGTSFPAPFAVGSLGSGVRREDDILFQWRLRRKMEHARLWCQESPSRNSVLHIPLTHTLGPNQKAHDRPNTTPLQRANLSFTPVSFASLDPPVPESSLPISSPSVSRLQPDASIQVQKQPDLDIRPNFLPQLSKESVTKNPEAHSVLPQHHRTQVSLVKTASEKSISQRSSSPSSLTSDSTEERWTAPHVKRGTAVRGKTENERREKKIAPASRKKKSDWHSVMQGSNPVRARHSRAYEGVSRKADEPCAKSRWKEECERLTGGERPGDLAPPPSPIHNALGQVVSEVLFPGADSPNECKTPSSSDSTPPPLQSPVAPQSSGQQPSEVIDQLMQDAEDSDGQEFEDDPLLQVLRQQRKLVKEQLCEVDVILQQLLPLAPPTGT
ncbi:proline and serine-rich protein 3 isoform X2 [Myxocyprinus asiaticus]|uniref:proline and serine-rich protein 3 isoform X2 n=1 Tax=Myxocyprinus asiaticus TaxID=70543 RepID=UPI00222349FE|nr:proline and serine-rich protein 3 isoform X2 [Myxocyprinus asiaticus]